jgi:hypothetical protein
MAHKPKKQSTGSFTGAKKDSHQKSDKKVAVDKAKREKNPNWTDRSGKRK